MAGIIAPSRSRLATALREPNLLVPNKKPVEILRPSRDFPNPIYLFVNEWARGIGSALGASFASGSDSITGDFTNDGSGSGLILSDKTQIEGASKLTIVTRHKWTTLATRKGVFGHANQTASAFSINTGYSTATSLFFYCGNYTVEFAPVGIGTLSANKYYNFVVTFDGARDGPTRLRLFIDGVQQSFTWASAISPDATIPSNAANFCFGTGNQNSACAQELSAVYGIAFPDHIAAEVSRNPFLLVGSANDTPYLFPVAGGGGVSAELTGNSSTAAVGTLGVATEGSVSVTPSGVFATSAVGTLGATAEINASAELTGVSSSSAVGTITAEVGGGTTANLSGNESAASVGTLEVSTEVNAFVDLLGNSATGAVGTLIVVTGLQVALSGNAATGAVGTLGVTAEVNASAALTGVGSSGAVGTLEITVPITASVELTGVGATGAIGTLTAVGAGQIWTEVPATSTTWTEIS